ncbi:putative ATPase/DNA-binding CsgD family transcriptional regulator [Nocardia sp. GAS34]|uniref:ATP-binding protein n=1 Tax=unclassified Nocardia TaxID=2637762 RepID=UPI003D1BFBD8
MDKIRTLLLGSAPLITLTGAGGIGKTRLATETLRGFRKASRTMVYWVRLAQLARGSDVDAIEAAVARSVVDADSSRRSAWDTIVDTLTGTDAVGRSLQTVLVMDNCEHVLLAAGQLIAELLEAVPGLTILATSREPVGWVDEHVVLVPPLTQKQAVTLFRQRAELVGHVVTGADEIAMATLVCRHLHDHPLFIRLAAARLRYQPLAMILQELSGAATDKRLKWSHGPSVGAEPRHRGIRDVISWSYALCQDNERLLLDRMSVFAAGYDTNLQEDTSSVLDVGADLEAIEAVCSDHPTPILDRNQGEPTVGVAHEEVEGLLERLADRSLVMVHITPTTVRYSLLESIRLFAQQRLAERSTSEVDESARIAQRYCRYYRDKLVAVQRNWYSLDEQHWARGAWDNIVTAIETSIASGEPALGLEIAANLIALPVFKGSSREIRQWAERTLEASRALTPQPTELQIGAMTSIGWLSMVQGSYEDLERMLEECAAACIEDPNVRQNWRTAPETDIGLPAPLEFLWGAQLMFAQRDARAVTVLSRAREKFHALGDSGGEGRSELYEAWATATFGSAQQALQITRRHLDHATASGVGWANSWAELCRAVALAKHGDPTEALAIGRTTLARQMAAHDQFGASLTVAVRTWSLAQIITDLISTGSTDRARLRTLATEIAQLSGGAKTLREGSGFDLENLALIAYENNKANDVARQVLRDEVFAAAYRQGSLLRPESCEVQRLALGTLSIDRMPLDHPARANLHSRWDELSKAERQVATLAAAGWTNTAIAARRGNSARTVDAQMAAILHKLTITSRKDIIKLIPQDQIGLVRKEVEEAAKRPPRRRMIASKT